MLQTWRSACSRNEVGWTNTMLRTTLLISVAVSMFLDGCGKQSAPTVQVSVSRPVPSLQIPKQQTAKNKYSGTLTTVAMLPRKEFSTLFWDSGWAHAKGTWILDGGKLGMPVQTSNITCIRDVGRCFHATAEVFGSMLVADSDVLEIERWDAHEIVTKPEDAECIRSTIRLNRDSETVSEIQTTIRTSGPCDGLGLKFGDQHLHMIDGFEAGVRIRSEQ